MPRSCVRFSSLAASGVSGRGRQSLWACGRARAPLGCEGVCGQVQFEKNILSDWEMLDAQAHQMLMLDSCGVVSLMLPLAQVIELHREGYRCRMTDVEVATCWRE